MQKKIFQKKILQKMAQGIEEEEPIGILKKHQF